MKHLVIVPKSVLSNWNIEFERWCPTLRIFTAYSEVKAERIKLVSNVSQDAEFDVCLTT